MTDERTGKHLQLPRQETPAGYVITGTDCVEVRSSAGREYRIMLAAPQSPPPAAGYPVIYLLDAEMCFGAAVEAVRWQTKPPKGYDPAVVVGIGYPSHLERVRERFLDYTTPAVPANLPVRGNGEPWPPLGGADVFLDFIEHELMPAVEARFPVDTGRLAIMGHSMGGFLVLHALFTRKSVYRTYVAGSPSIWWNGSALLKEEEAFRQKLEDEAKRRKTLECAGREENSGRPEPDHILLIAAGGFEGGSKSRMLENAMEMGGRLSALDAPPLKVVVKEFEGEGHISVVPALLAKGIRLSLAKTVAEREWNV